MKNAFCAQSTVEFYTQFPQYVISELLAEAEVTVKYQASSVVDCKCAVSLFDKLIVNILPYSIPMIISCKSVARIRRDLAALLQYSMFSPKQVTNLTSRDNNRTKKLVTIWRFS